MALKAFRTSLLVSPEWLNRIFQVGDAVKVLDCSWHLPNTGRNAREEYTRQHIPGALFFDIDECADKTSDLPHMLPKPADFEKYVGSLGINNRSLIVAYDNNPQFGVFSAPRVWWMFRYFGHDNITVLEGGLPKWISDGFDATDDCPTIDEEEDFFAKPYDNILKSYQDIINNLQTKEFQLLDARPSGRFQGTAPEPRQDIKPGHIPNSVNIPFMDVLNKDDRTMKSIEELLEIFERADVDLDRAVAASCGTGVTASILTLAAYVCGKRNVSVYDGAWTEWYQRAPPELKEGVPSD